MVDGIPRMVENMVGGGTDTVFRDPMALVIGLVLGFMVWFLVALSTRWFWA